MARTVTETITDVRSHLDETTARQWSDTELTRWINEAVRDIARRAEVLQSYEDINAVVGQQEYTLQSTVLRVHRVEWRPSGGNRYPLEYRDFNSMDAVWWTQQTTQSYHVSYFTLWGYPPSLKMMVYPTPSTAGSFRVFEYIAPADVSGATNLSIPEGWWDLIPLYCEYVALRKDADPRWQEAKVLYEERLTALIDYSRRWSDQADAIQVAGGPFIPGWLYNP